MFIFRAAHPAPKLYCMESFLRSDVWLNDSTTNAQADNASPVFPELRKLSLVYSLCCEGFAVSEQGPPLGATQEHPESLL